MTEKEAIERLTKSAYRITCYGNKVIEREENLVAIQALEKQIPKKPIKNSQFEDFKCPVCGSPDIRLYDTEYCRYDKEWVFDYCSDCGQKIDWGDEE